MTQARQYAEKDELDWHDPLFDRKDFKAWVQTVVLPEIRVKPVSTRQIRVRLGSKLGDERAFTLGDALSYLLFKDLIFPVESYVTMYTSKKPKEKKVKKPKKEEFNWNQGLAPLRPPVPHFQQFIPEVPA